MGVLSSIVIGPDATGNVANFAYGVEGVSDAQLQAHLQNIASYLSQMIPDAQMGKVKFTNLYPVSKNPAGRHLW